ncbi:MAG: class I SAM-dependent methyltransferase [Ilumatobacteraceae bacterium]
MNDSQVTPLEQQQLRVAADGGDTFWHRVRFRLVLQAARRSGASTVLDIGAGSGQLGDWLARSAGDIAYRFEEDSAVLDTLLTERFGEAHRGTTDEPIPASTLAVMLDVLEHIEHDDSMLRGLHARMAPGAQLFITVPAFQWAFSSWDTSLGHHRRYSRPQLRDQARAAGFRVDQSSYLFPELLPPVLLRKWRRSEREGADFPSLPRAVDRTAEAVSRGTAAVRRIWPAGTSVVALLTREGPLA